MTTLQDLTTEELRERVRVREAMIRRWAEFMERVADEQGRVVFRKVYSDHTHVVQRLDGFGGFSFLSDTGQSMMGAETFKVWYHPGDKTVDMERTDPVLVVEGPAPFRVLIFSRDPAWQTALDDVISREKEILAQMQEAKQQHAILQAAIAAENAKREELLEIANRLGLGPGLVS